MLFDNNDRNETVATCCQNIIIMIVELWTLIVYGLDYDNKYLVVRVDAITKWYLIG